MLRIVEKTKEPTGSNGKTTAFFSATTPALATEEPSAISQDFTYTSVEVTEKEANIRREQRSRVQLRSVLSLKTPAKRAVNDELNQAFKLITDACDTNLEPAERSNSFDDWSDKLKLLARKARHFTINHNTIIGSMITTTSDRDISDFSIDILKFFLNATNLLRRPSLTKRDSTRVLSGFIESNLNITWSFKLEETSENSQEQDQLDYMMQALLKKSRLKK